MRILDKCAICGKELDTPEQNVHTRLYCGSICKDRGKRRNRRNKQDIKTIIVLPDVHLETEEQGISKPYQLVKKFIHLYKPDEIVILGDFMNLDSLSHWVENKRGVMENKRYFEEIEFANKELDFLAENTNKITYIEGNHENWVQQYIDKDPRFEGMMELSKVLKFKERNITWIPMNELYKVGSIYLTHGLTTCKYHANNHLLRLGCSICYGHTHTFQTHMLNMRMQDPLIAYGLGCLCNHTPSYLKGNVGAWVNQFAVILTNTLTETHNLYPITISSDNTFIFGNMRYALD